MFIFLIFIFILNCAWVFASHWSRRMDVDYALGHAQQEAM